MTRTMLVCCVLAVGAMLVTLAAGCEPKKGASQAPKIIKERIVSAKTEPPKAVKAAMPKGPVSELVLPTGATRAAVTQKDFVMDWLVLGPFEFRETDFGGGHQQSSADHLFMPNEANLDGSQEAPKGTSWRPVHFQGDANPGQVNLDELYNAVEHAAAYAVAWLDCPNEIKDAKLYVGSDDYLKVWVNGKLVHTYKTERRASAADQDIVPGVTLKKGLNRVVVKCVDVVLAWDFYLRLTDAKDRPIAVKVKG